MPVASVDHVNIRCVDPDKTCDFFRKVLRMRVGGPPGVEMKAPGGWVYGPDGRAAMHVGGKEIPYPTDHFIPFVPEATKGSGAVHHVALNCTAFEEMKRHFRTIDIAFEEVLSPQFGVKQLFVHDPNGILFELNFPWADEG